MTKGYTPTLPERFPNKGEQYCHYKGDVYEVVGLAIHSNEDVWMVVYKPQYENADAEMFTLPLSDWFSEVSYNGERIERFHKV
jgi:hypothetical protein